MLAGEKNAPDIFTHPFQGSHLVQIKGPGVESNLALIPKFQTNDYKFGSVEYSLKLLIAIDPMDP